MDNNLEDKKYELVEDDKIQVKGKTLYRIRALKYFGDVNAGELGGYVMSEKNLSHEGECWVGENAKVYDAAKVIGDAQVSNHAHVYGYAKVSECADICGTAKVSGIAIVKGNMVVNC